MTLSVDDLMLEMTNDRATSDYLDAAVMRFAKHVNSQNFDSQYTAFRSSVYKMCRKFEPKWSASDRIKTSILTEEVYLHYYEGIKGTACNMKKVQEHFRDYFIPKWVLNDLHQGDIDDMPPAPRVSESNTFDEPMDCQYAGMANMLAARNSTTNKENEMSQISTNKLIDSRTYINGVESSQVTDEKIFGMISNFEAEIEALNKIKNQPKALKAKVEFLQNQIDELVAFVDARTGETA